MVYGIVADTVVGRLLAGNNLHITNATNNFRLDETGAWLNNANFTITKAQGGVTNRIVLDPIEGFTIYKGNERQIYLGTNGDVHFRGTINGGSININNNFIVDGAGNTTIRRGSITIGNRFSVNDTGFLRASDVDVSGNIRASNITSSTMNGGSIIGSSINIGNGAATISSNGFATFNDIHIRNRSSYNVGWGNTSCAIDSNGMLRAKNAEIEGHIEARTGTFHEGVDASRLRVSQIVDRNNHNRVLTISGSSFSWTSGNGRIFDFIDQGQFVSMNFHGRLILNSTNTGVLARGIWDFNGGLRDQGRAVANQEHLNWVHTRIDNLQTRIERLEQR